MYAYIARVRSKGRLYEYLQVCETVRRNGKPTRRTLGSLGRLDQLDPGKVDGLIRGLRRFAWREGEAWVRPAEAPIVATRVLGPVLVGRKLWEELGVAGLVAQGQKGFAVEEALFRLVLNRLVDPMSKLSCVEWQEGVEWPRAGKSYGYDDYLRAMDVLHSQKEELEEALFLRVRDLFSVPLRLVWYDLTSSYFEGDGVCELAEYGHSRDHRGDRAQIVMGLAITQEGFPIAHDVFPGSTGDVGTVAGMAQKLKERFGLQNVVLVGDRGLLSGENAHTLDGLGMGYVLALRTRQHSQVTDVVEEAIAKGLERPSDPDAEWTVAEVEPREGMRHVVVYSAFRAIHDRVVRRERLRRTRDELRRLAGRVASGRLKSERKVAERATRILSGHKAGRYFEWELRDGAFGFWLDSEFYRRQRKLDGVYVLVSNDDELSVHEIVSAYRQLHEVEDAFRVLKSLVKLRPIYHWTKRRVEAHVFICVLGYLLAKVMEQRLRKAGLEMTAARALRHLEDVRAVDQEWGDLLLTHMTRPSPQAQAILRAFNLPAEATILKNGSLATG